MSNIDNSDFQKARCGKGQIVVVSSKATANQICDLIIEGIGRDVIHTRSERNNYMEDEGVQTCSSYYVTVTVKRGRIYKSKSDKQQSARSAMPCKNNSTL